MEYRKTVLKKGRDIPVRAGHPWVFSGGIESADKTLSTGDFTDIYSSDGNYIATASYHAGNSIRARVISRTRGESFDTDFFVTRFSALSESKKRLLPENTDGFRLVHSDADCLPGLVVDMYGKHCVIQINTKAMERLRDNISGAVLRLFRPESIIERSDIESRKGDGLRPLDPACLYGSGGAKAVFTENNVKMIADTEEGQKTGFFLDQRDARIFIKKISSGKKVLNLFSYSGGFSVSAAAGGASAVTNVDVSERALDVAQEIFRLNRESGGIKAEAEYIQADVFDYIYDLRHSGKGGSYGIIICDPPAFAKKMEKKPEAVRAYIRLNRMCLEAASPGTVYLASSCSGIIGWSDFMDILKTAAGQAGKNCSVIAEFSQAADHTRTISFPEGSYLKTAALLVTG